MLLPLKMKHVNKKIEPEGLELTILETLHSTVTIHFPFKIAMRTFNVLVHAPLELVEAMTCVTLGLQYLDTIDPLLLANSIKEDCIFKVVN